MKIYKLQELESFRSHIAHARNLWAHAARAEFSRIGDTGSCICSDGIEILLLRPRCRKPVRHCIIPSGAVACCQGSIHYENAVAVALEYLKEQGIDVAYNFGRMD